MLTSDQADNQDLLIKYGMLRTDMIYISIATTRRGR